MPEDDSRLLEAARRGNERAFLALYHRHRTPLFRFAWRLTGSVPDAEDAVQECFTALLDGSSFHAGRGPLRAYLFGITRNLALSRMRVTGREAEQLEDTGAPAGALDGLLSMERSAAVARAVAALPPLQREVLILFHYENLSLEEIAEVTGAETGAVKARLHRARETMRRRLAPLITDRRLR